jgi:hypothetical protein
MKGAAVVAAGLLGAVVGELWFSPVDVRSTAAIAEQNWLPVTDSVTTMLDAKLADGARLSPAELAALIFRSPRRRAARIEGLEARIDSLLWVRGRLREGSRFEFGGEVRVVRRGLAELRVTHLVVDGVETDSTAVSRLVAGPRVRSPSTDRLRFEVPGGVASFLMREGGADVLRRERP